MSQITDNRSVWRQKAHTIFLFAVSAYLLLWLAIANGYPIFYSDTFEYLKDSLTLVQPIHHGLGYSFFIRLVNLGASPWLIVIAQSFITAFILHSVLKLIIREAGPARRQVLIFPGLVVFLAIGTTLPWFVGQIMPDAFTGLAPLSLFLLLYDSEMSLERTLVTCLAFCLSLGTHVTHLLAITVLLAIILISRAFSRFREIWPARPAKGIVLFVLIPMMAVASLVAASNRHAGYGFSLAPAGSVFLLGKLIDNGFAAPYLEEQCKKENLTPCKYLHNLPKSSNDFYWGDHPLLKEMGGWNGAVREANRIVTATILFNPLGFAKECVKGTLRQFVMFADPGADYPPFTSGELFETFLNLYPGEVPRYLYSRQSARISPTGHRSGLLQRDSTKLAPIYAGVFWCSLGVSLIAPFSRRFGFRIANQLCILTLIFLFANASVTGPLSDVVYRYQSRASWLMAMCCAAYLIPYVTGRPETRQQALFTASGRCDLDAVKTPMA